MKIRKRNKEWWIIDTPDNHEFGPYATKKEAETDLTGIREGYKMMQLEDKKLKEKYKKTGAKLKSCKNCGQLVPNRTKKCSCGFKFY